MDKSAKHLLFGILHDCDGTLNNTWTVKTINLQNLHYRQISTCYEYVVPVAITIPPEATCLSSNVNVTMICNLLQYLAGTSSQITRVLTTNLVVNVMTMGLVETISNDLGTAGKMEVKKKASILVVYCKNYLAMMHIYTRLKTLRPNYVFILPHEDHLYFGFEVFVKTHGQISPDFESTSTMMRHAHFKTPNVCIKSVYTPYGLYTLRKPKDMFNNPYGGLEIVLSDKPPPPLHHVMPVISMDIETIAESTNVIPMGVTSDEKLSSLVLYCVYGQAQYCLILFLLPPNVPHSVGQEFCNNMTLKYSDPTKRRAFHFMAMPSERTLLSKFTKMYLRGTILSLFKLPANYPHVFVGHNIFQYDIPFIVERYKYHDLQAHLLETGTIAMSNSKQVTFNFLENALLFDSLFLAKANCLSGTYGLSAVARARLPDHKVGKMELNSVTIRNLYNIAQKQVGGGFVSEDLQEIFKIDKSESMNKYEDSETQGRLNLSEFPIRFCKLRNTTLAVPCMETILAYNIQDTITVFNIMVESNIFTIINQLTNLFGVQMDAASMRGNSYRIGACMTIEALEDGQFLYSLVDKRPPDTCVTPAPLQKSLGSPFAALRLATLMKGRCVVANLTKGGFRGALNYAAQGVHPHGKSLDFKSYYPNLMRFLNCDYGSCDIVCQKDLVFLNRSDSLMKLTQRGFLDLYRMDDPLDVDTLDLLDPRYRGREIGQCLTWNDVLELTNPDTPILMVLRDPSHTTKDSFLTKLITKMLTRRDELKAQLKKEADPVLKVRLDSQQLSVKILLNSKYGLKGDPTFHNCHVPLSAAVTMFGRKFLTICSRLIECFQILARKEHYTDQQVAEVREHINYLKGYSLNWRSCTQERAKVHHDAENSPPTKTTRYIFEPERFVCYVDTDGIKYSDPYNINTETICKQVNDTLTECLGVNYLALSVEPEVDRLLVLTCKSYASFCHPDHVSHKGYELNVNPRIKYIFNAIVRVTNLYMKQEDPPLYILFDIFSHLEMANQAMMYERVKLNKHKNESNLQRYICSVTRDFRGDVATVMIQNPKDVQQDNYMTHAEWLNSDDPPPINTYKFIRKNFLVLLRLIFLDAITMQKIHLQHDKEVAALLLTHTQDRYGRPSVGMNWKNIKDLGTIAYMICSACITGDANEAFIKDKAILYRYCNTLYTKYKSLANIRVNKLMDITQDGLRPKCTVKKEFTHVFYEIFSKYD